MPNGIKGISGDICSVNVISVFKDKVLFEDFLEKKLSFIKIYFLSRFIANFILFLQ